jgi:hypothetical protein
MAMLHGRYPIHYKSGEGRKTKVVALEKPTSSSIITSLDWAGRHLPGLSASIVPQFRHLTSYYFTHLNVFV